MRDHGAHVIVLGNAKGGSGKSTTAMHIVARLLAMGHSVGAIDLDGRQQTLGRYIENRQQLAQKRGVQLPLPALCVINPSTATDLQTACAEEQERLSQSLATLEHCDFVVLDCPGADTFLTRIGHAVADTLVTPLNDSFIDLDLLARVDPDSYKITKPSWYSEMVWEMRKRRYLQDKKRTDWVVIRNRLLHTDTRNKRHMQGVLDKLGPRIGFRHAPGLSDRVIFRELFLRGLTLSDLRLKNLGVELTMSHITAHQELRDLVASLGLPRVTKKVA